MLTRHVAGLYLILLALQVHGLYVILLTLQAHGSYLILLTLKVHGLYLILLALQVHRLVSWCCQPSQLRRVTSGLNTNFTLSYSFKKSSYHRSCFLKSLFIFRGHSTREPASSRVTYFILWAYTGTMLATANAGKKWERFRKKCMRMDRKGTNKEGRNPRQ